MKITDNLTESNVKYKDADSKMVDIIKLSFKKTFYWNDIPLSFFMTAFSYILKDYSKAVKWLKQFIKTTSNSNSEYYNNLLTFLEIKQNTKNHTEVLSEEIINKLESDFKDIQSIFSHIELPQCPFCDICKLYDNCLTTRQFDKTKLINKAMARVEIDQNIFKNIL